MTATTNKVFCCLHIKILLLSVLICIFARAMNTIAPAQIRANFSPPLTNATVHPGKDKSPLLLLPILCFSIQLLGIAGNGLVIHAISTQRHFQTNYYYLVYHLAVSDLIVLLAYGEKTLNYCIPSLKLITTSAACKLSGFFKTMFYTTGVAFLVFIGLLRYRGAIHPFKPRFTRKKMRCLVAASYLASFFVSVSFALFRVVNKNNVCTFLDQFHVYSVVMSFSIVFLDFLTPFVLLHVVYLKIIYRLWVQQRVLPHAALGSGTEDNGGGAQARQRRFFRASFASFVIVVLFSLSTAPYEILWLLDAVGKTETSVGVSFWAFFVKLFGNWAINPLIYGVADSSLRHSFRLTFRRIVKCFKR